MINAQCKLGATGVHEHARIIEITCFFDLYQLLN